MLKFIKSLIAVSALFSIVRLEHAQAIVIDDFEAVQIVEASLNNTTNFSMISAAGVIGGSRLLESKYGALSNPIPGLTVKAVVFGGKLFSSFDDEVTGVVSIAWSAQGSGMGEFDLTQDNADAFRLIFSSFEAGNVTSQGAPAQSLGIQIIIRTSTGSEHIADVDVTEKGLVIIPFNIFSNLSPGVFSSLERIVLRLNTKGNFAPDFSIEGFETNGNCAVVPTAASPDAAKLDLCGECGGDNTSCVSCIVSNIFDLQADLDGAAKDQEIYAIGIANALSSLVNPPPPLVKRIDKFLKRINELQNENWIASWGDIETEQNSCDNSLICVSVSNLEFKDEYTARAEEMDLLIKKIVRRSKRYVTRFGDAALANYTRSIRKQRRASVRVLRRALNVYLPLVPNSTDKCL